MSKPPFKNLNLRRDCIISSLSDFGVANISYEPKNSSGHHHLKGIYDGQNILLNIFENKDGSTTVGQAAGHDKNVFESLASEIVFRCSYSEKKSWSFLFLIFQSLI
ncbi:MAG: hypothetical protein NTY60_02780 [Proteobacteria bacterium]|nr:hypothetical protein [Pseudomonadota bacterium]